MPVPYAIVMGIRTLRAAALASRFVFAALAASPAAAYDWLQFNGDAAHSGNNALELGLGRGNVSALALKFRAALPAVADGAPVLLQAVATAAGVRDRKRSRARGRWHGRQWASARLVYAGGISAVRCRRRRPGKRRAGDSSCAGGIERACACAADRKGRQAATARSREFEPARRPGAPGRRDRCHGRSAGWW